MFEPKPFLQTGDCLGAYRIESSLGAGGMGEVFCARDTRLGRRVALKLVMHGHEVEPEHQRRLLKEAQAASALNHPNIVAIHDICSHQGRDFLVMEYVEGRTLKDLIGDEGLPLQEVVKLGIQISEALDAAHQAGIVHRDLKPANVMVTRGQIAKVLDFGIARILGEAVTIDGSDIGRGATMIGTLHYMSPEQARGEAVDQRSDIFSLGTLLYEAATGTLPFSGDGILTVLKQIEAALPVPPSSMREALPPAFDHLIAKCLAKNPAARPSAKQVAETLCVLETAVHEPAPVREITDGRRVVAVVPFRFHGAAKDDEFLSVALAETVATRLGSASTLAVRPTSSLMKYVGKDKDWTQVARETNANVVVDGSIQKAGSRVRTMVQILEARDTRTVCSLKIDGQMDDLFDFQDRLAESVFEALVPQARNRRETAAEPATRHPLAFELYMRAISQSQALRKIELQGAIEMLERAIELDPQFGDAWGRIASISYQIGAHLDPDPKWFTKAEAAAAHALELDPINCDGFCVRGLLQWSPSRGFQFGPALRALNIGLKINPSRYFAQAHRGVVLFHMGFHEIANQDYDECLYTNPDYSIVYTGQSYIAQYMGDFARAEELVQRALALEPTSVISNIFAPLPAISMGNLNGAREKLRKVRQMVPEEPQLLSMEGLMLALEGDFRKAEQLADETVASKRSLVHSHHSWHCAAEVYALCGKPEKAIQELKRCAENGLPNHRAFLRDDYLRPLHGHPEFENLIRELRRDYEEFRQEFNLSENLSAAEGAA